MASIVRNLGLALAVVVLVMAGLVGPDWFMAIPWWVRWRLGMACFLGLLAGAYALAFRHAPPRPWPLLEPARAPDASAHRRMAWLLHAIALSFALPLFAHPGCGGVWDWDLHLAWYEAMRLSVLRWGQFPWWNPWICGGFPLAAEVQFGLVSLDTPLALLLGAPVGLRVAAVAYLMLATEGARRLARLWLADPWAAGLATVVYAWGGAVIPFTVVGHAITMSHPFLPWMLYHAFRLGRGAGPAALLGFTAAASVLTVIQYTTAYAMIVTAPVLLWGLIAARGLAARRAYVVRLGLAAGVFLALAGWRLAATGCVLADFPRPHYTEIHDSPWHVLRTLLAREVPPPRINIATREFDPEWIWYVGILPVLAAAASVRRGWRWWHTLAAGSLAMAMGSVEIYHPSYWVGDWPGFSAMHMVGRWRFPALLGLALAAGDEVQSWRAAGSPSRRAMVAAMVLVVIGDLALYAHQSLPTAFSVPPAERQAPGPPVETIVNVERCGSDYYPTRGYEAVSRGYGVIRGFCPQLDYDLNRPTTRLWRGHPAYVGEFVVEGRPVAPEFWSPNRVVLRVGPNQEVEVNQNPGSYWWANGRQLFPSWRCAEIRRRFVARADATGRLVLEARPRGLRLAAALTASGFALTGACLWLGGVRVGPRSVAGGAGG